jgi:hypothetical protein
LYRGGEEMALDTMNRNGLLIRPGRDAITILDNRPVKIRNYSTNKIWFSSRGELPYLQGGITRGSVRITGLFPDMIQ